MECPDENTLVALAEGLAPSEIRAIHARHLDACAACRETVGSLVRIAGFAPTVGSERPPPSASTVASVAGDLIAQRYRLDRIIGEGGLGVVWAATHVVTMKPVALKILKVRYPEVDKRFLREARVAGVVNHPNIVDVHDVVEVERDGSLAMVMELLEGEPLDRYLEARKRLSLEETLAVMHPVLSALAAAHALGIVHRDLKPQNIFLARDGSGASRPMLLDFGLAKLTATEGVAAQTSELTRERQLLGTPHYMAPEQLYGESDIDARADVWAVGAVLFECLSGERPLPGSTVGQLLRSLATREIPKIDTVVPDLPPKLAAIIDTMLTRDRASRLSSVETWLAAAAEQLASARG